MKMTENTKAKEEIREEQQTETQPQAESHVQPQADGERLFTQKEVEAIITKRLAREHAKVKESVTTDEELTARANLLDCKEYVLNNGLSVDLLDILDTTDVAAFKAKAEKLHTMSSRPALYPYVKDGGEPVKQDFESEAIKKAFAGAAHIPKKY